jgi:outer membrane protein TolC
MISSSKIFLVLAVVLVILFLTLVGFAETKEIALSLEDCLVRAMKNNLGVAVELFNPELAGANLSRAREQFYPTMAFAYGLQNTNSASFSWIDAEAQIQTDFADYRANLTQLIPTGGQFQISLYSYRNETNQKFQTINPRFGSTLTMGFSQPLLKDFGFKITQRQIIIARNNLEISEHQLRSVILNTVYQVEEAYWNLVYSIENLKVMQQSLDLARDLLAKNKREVEVGTVAPIEVLSAEAEVAIREADILQAEAAVKNNEALLKTYLNMNADEAPATAVILPLDSPSVDIREVSLEEALSTAAASRPDIASGRLAIDNGRIDFGYAKNQLLPDVRLEANYWSPGISGTRILYQDDNPLSGVVIGTQPGGARNALQDAMKFRYKNWYVGVSLSLPINNVLSRAQYAQAKLNLGQSQVRLQNLEQQINLEVQNAVRAVETNYRRVLAYRAARVLAEKSLEAEQKKHLVGLTTNYTVLQVQRDLATARSAELRAVIDYNLSLAGLDRSTGASLESRNILIRDIGARTS